MEIKGFRLNQIETKSVSPYTSYQLNSLLSDYAGNYLSPSQAYWLYSKSDAIGNAIDKIAWAFEQMNPVLLDTKTNEYVTDHPLLSLIEEPGYDMSSDRFQFELMVSYLSAGECYPILIGNVKYEPHGLSLVKASKTSLIEGDDGNLERIIKTNNNRSEIFDRKDNPKRRMWTYQKSDELKEMVQILNQSKNNGVGGQSVLERVYYQALTKYYGNIHNSGLLKNGMRPSGIISPDGFQMGQVEFEKYKEEINDYLVGPSNSGRVMTPPVPIKYQNLILNPRDMDFINLIENSRVEIYNQYDIPLPLVTTQTMTLNNYANAIEAFYDMSVMPRAKFLYKQLGKFALSRYKDGDRFLLTINEKEIPALKERMFRIVKEMRVAQAFSENEMRTIAGYEGIGDEGDKIWKQSNWIPSGEDDDYTRDNILRRETERIEQEEIQTDDE